MKLQLPKWFSATKATLEKQSTAEVVAQLEQRLVEADAECTSAEHRSQELLAKFAENRAAETLEAQEVAESDLARLRKLRGLVAVDLESARSKLAAEKRADLERRKDQLTAEIADHSEELRLAKAMAHTFTPVVEALLARQAHAENTRAKNAQLHSVKLELGEPSEMRFDRFDWVLSPFMVVEELKRLAQEHAGDATRAAMFYKFSQLLETWR